MRCNWLLSTPARWLQLVVVYFCVGTAWADVELPNIFSDHMVLQRNQPNKVWGRAAPGEKVTVTIGDIRKEATADEQGNWSVMLDPLDVGEPRRLVASCDHNQVVVEDVLVGEVWICSGQSNMQWPVDRTNDPDLVKATANFSQIRMISYPNVGSQTPVWTHPQATWKVCSPETVGSFSAVGYFFGLQLYQALGVPIGLVNNSWGGSAADAWINRDLLEADPQYRPTLERWQQMEAEYEQLANRDNLSDEEARRLRSLERQMGGNHRPGNIYNGVLKSHLGYGIRGAIWYQGESNANRAYQYRHLFPMMIQNWRDEWGAGDFPFYWVQLADFQAEKPEPSESAWAELREAQTMTMFKLPHTGQAVIIDLGEGKDIHPRNKEQVGQRLSRWALAKDYGLPVAAASPMYQSMEKQGNKIVLSFEHVHGGFRPFDVNTPIGFAIAGEDRKFVWAEAKIVGNNQIEVWSDQVADPVAVRYAWADNPVCNMYDELGLPLTPFRTDDWPGVTVNNY
ncbi:MAG: 9-O-acetylesterase [Pirellulaceae bacterium]|nr:MAG: 9-O-acetylesterase [Pirellulaceae bacterium]